MEYDFSRLSTRSFEQLIQAIALESIGPGVSIFGDGPDGAREATFEGTVSFPSLSEPWGGYGVVQAKFRQKPGIRDSEWALTELKADLDKFLDVNRNLRKPEYYIFATNVILTPVAEIGGKDKVNALLSSYKKKIGIKDFRIWDRDQLNAYLDLYENIRTSYAAWVTSGDVLTAVLKNMGAVRPDFRSVMMNFVRKELTSEQYVNLGQAGSSTDDKIPLACVFVDVPISGNWVPSPSERITFSNQVGERYTAEEEQEEHENYEDYEHREENDFSAVKNLLHISSQRLDSASQMSREIKDETYISQIPGRVVFIGGPGQGKSTLTQFFCQMHRASLLFQDNANIITPEVTTAYELILEQCGVEGISPPKIPRFPVKIELNRFASALAKGQTTSLLSYILAMIKRRCDREIAADDLRAWLRAYPWLLALDGLDEVPASSNRAEVLQKVDDFLIDAQECNADLMIVATSRPQGYNDDFAEKYYCHLTLSPLTSMNALHYAERLITRRWGADHDKVTLFLQRIGRASEEDSTVRLMRSPLQVTIMTLLVESLGEPPKERWRLFNEYYQVINRREKERDIPAAKLLNTYQADIDVIHQEVGKVLQIKSEVSGSTDALLTTDQFSLIIDSRLESEGHSDTERYRLRQEILSAALERLVFLVAPQEGRVGFEIRSLQEFMAAQALMNGRDEDVVSRLKSIAHASHWRNVFLFAAGRCFYERQHLRDRILSLCMDLNEDIGSPERSRLPSTVLAGSQLAIDILEDGAISNQPAQRRFFLRLAMRVLELPPSESHMRLAALYDPAVLDVYKEHLLHLLHDSSLLRFYGAWHVILILVAKKVSWACAAADQHWPWDSETAMSIIRSSRKLPSSEFLLEKACQAFVQSPPVKASKADIISIRRIASKSDVKVLGWMSYLIDVGEHRADRPEILIEGVSKSFRLNLDRGRLEKPVMPDVDGIHPLWEWLFKAFNLGEGATGGDLSKLFDDLSSISNCFTPDILGDWAWHLPWPVMTCIRQLTNDRDLAFYARQAEIGALGSDALWESARERWFEVGVTLADLNYIPGNDLPFDANINVIGFPLRCAGASIFSSKDRVNSGLFELIGKIERSSVRSELAGKYLFSLSCAGASRLEFGSRELEELPNILSLVQDNWVHISFLKALPSEYWEFPQFQSVINFMKGKRYFSADEVDDEFGIKVERLLYSNKSSAELLKLLYVCCERGFNPTSMSEWVAPEKFESLACKGHAALICLSRGRVSAAMVGETAMNILNGDNHLSPQYKKSLVQSALKFIAPASLSDEVGAALLINLQDGLDIHHLSLKSMVFDSMQELQRSHLSTPFLC
ncbi:NACHT domain-containing protein [Pseudomonas rhizosphaerae]|uniref:NACHT domain-containing protein n=1 Tax=Pseudomonas rhizosphaerae TaxID=216142 RepID=UPI000B0DC409|nr:hypothetical protein [Pseudomonas rhizosphaerae]